MIITQKSDGRVLQRYGWVCHQLIGIHSYPYIYPFFRTKAKKVKPFLFPGNILPLSLRESDGTYQMTSSGDNQWLPLAPGQIHLSHPVESISFFKFEIPWDSSLHNSKHLDR
jgi:hypothetical protein